MGCTAAMDVLAFLKEVFAEILFTHVFVRSCFFFVKLQNVTKIFLAGDGRCIIDKARRNWCPYCRLQRCFAVQMNVTGM